MKKKNFLLFSLFTCVVATVFSLLILGDLKKDEDWQERERENWRKEALVKAQKIVGEIQYIYDAKTDMCYAVYYRPHNTAITIVPYEKVKHFATVIGASVDGRKVFPEEQNQ